MDLLFEAEPLLNWIFEGSIFVSLESQQYWLELYVLISESLIFVGVILWNIQK